MFKSYAVEIKKNATKTTTDHVVITKNESGRIILFSCADESTQSTLVNSLIERKKSVCFFNILQDNQLSFYRRMFETYVKGDKIFKPETVDFTFCPTSLDVELFVDKILNSPADVMLYQMVSWEDVDITDVN